MNQSQDEYQLNHWAKYNHKMTHEFSPEVHVLVGMLVFMYRLTLGGSAANRYHTHLAHQKGAARTYP
jgi:hypothetical protein